jgi:F0F1-type ATP synthase membrane subunit c/vacuolar-type H+-ATPase subunit K
MLLHSMGYSRRSASFAGKHMTSKTYFQQLTILMRAMVAGIVVFAVVVSFLIATQGPIAPDLHAVFQYMAPMIALSGILGSYFVVKLWGKSLSGEVALRTKMNTYRTARVIGFALLDGAALFSIISYLMTGQWMYLASAGFVLLVFLLNRPTPQQSMTSNS